MRNNVVLFNGRTNTESSASVPQTKHLAGVVSLHLQGKREEALEQLQFLTGGSDSIPEAHFAYGRINFELRKFDEAASGFSRFLECQPEHITGHYNLGLCLQNLARWGDASIHFRKVLEIDSTHRMARHGLAICTMHEQKLDESLEIFSRLFDEQREETALFGKAVVLQLLSEVEQARESYEEVLRINPQSREALTNLIILHRQSKKTSEMKRCAQLLLGLDEDSHAGFEGLATAAFYDGDYLGCAKACEDSLRRNDASFDTWCNLGLAWQKAGEFEKAIQSYHKALALRPESVETIGILGWLHHELGQWQDACSNFERALGLSPHSAELLLGMGSTLESAGHWDKAEQVLSRMVELHPNRADGWFRLGYVNLQRKDYDMAALDFDTCLELRPHWREAELNLSLAHFRRSDFAASRSVLDTVLAREPDSLEGWRGMAAVHLEEGNDEAALLAHERLIALGDRAPDVLYNTALLCQRLGMLERASEFYRQSLAARTDFAEALLNLGHTLWSLGRTDEAKQSWLGAIQEKPDLALGYFLRD